MTMPNQCVESCLRKSTANNYPNQCVQTAAKQCKQSSANSNAHNNISTVGKAKQNNGNSMTKTQSKTKVKTSFTVAAAAAAAAAAVEKKLLKKSHKT